MTIKRTLCVFGLMCIFTIVPFQASAANVPHREQAVEKIDSLDPVLNGKFVITTYSDDYIDTDGKLLFNKKRKAVSPAIDGKGLDTTKVQVQTISGRLATILVPSSSIEDSLKQMVNSSNIVRILAVDGSTIERTSYSAYTGFHFSLGSYQFDTPWNTDDAKVIGSVNETKSKNAFTDVSYGSWAEGSIYLLASNHIVAGVGNNQFSPKAPVTRAAFMRMLSGVAQRSGMNLSTTIVSLPEDISDASWAKADVFKIKAYVDTKEKGSFDSILGSSTHLKPNSPITRSEAAQILSFFVGRSESGDWSFQDWNGGIEKERVANLFQNGIIVGVSATQFDPQGALTREQMAAIIARMNYVIN